MSDNINTGSKGPAKRRTEPVWKEFVSAVIAADGEWVEMKRPTEISPASASNGIATHMGRSVAEIAIHDGVAYARMRTRGETDE